MCRIFGHFAADVTPHEVRTASLLQRHGGPDAQQITLGTGWALGSNRLAIVDLDGGNQPFSLADGRIQVVFNGEIYNHHRLRRDLRARGYRFEDENDGSILPALYEVHGPAFAEHLEGMFAVAIVDLRHEPTMHLATDISGMKPLYYSWDEASGQIRFSSELPALLALGGISREPWLPGLDSYLTTKTPFGEQTMFRDVKIFPAGTTARINRSGGLTVTRRSRPERSCETADLDASGAVVRSLLTEEIANLTMGDVGVSTIVSGGLDSSLVTTLLAGQVSDLHSFTIGYAGDWPFDEKRFAAEVADRAGTVHHEVISDPQRFPDLLPAVAWHLGQPNADPITLSSYALFEAIHDAGFKVTLSGDAADEIFSGYDRIRHAMRSRGDWAADYVDALAAVPEPMRRALYSDDYAAEIDRAPSVRDDLISRLHAHGDDRLGAITDLEIHERLPAYHLRRVDHLSMAHSVEVRLAFCQPSVVETALSLPDDHRVHGDEVKRALYRAARGVLPTSVLERKKQPFTLPITSMLAPGQPLMEHARDLLAPSEVRREGLLDPFAVGRLLSRQEQEPSDSAAMAIWSLLMYRHWQVQFGAISPSVHRRRNGFLEVVAA